jgi:hypothetical protein
MWDAQYNTLRKAKDLVVGDELLTGRDGNLSEHGRQLVLGMMLGDGFFRYKGDYFVCSWWHKQDHLWYTNWKRSLIASGNQTRAGTCETQNLYDPQIVSFLRERKAGVTGHNKRMSKAFVEALDLVGLAVWYMDDAAKGKKKPLFKMQSYPIADVKMLVDVLNRKYGTGLTFEQWNDAGSATGKGYGVQFCERMMTLIAPYVHLQWRQVVTAICSKNAKASGITNSATLKRHVPNYVKLFGEFKAWQATKGLKPVKLKIKAIENIPISKVQRQVNINGQHQAIYDSHRYEIEVKDLGLFLADGVVAKNSPDYEPGGEALKFYSDVRNKQTARSVPHGKGPIEIEESVRFPGKKEQYRYIKFDNIKNKTATPMLDGWGRLTVNNGKGKSTGFDIVYDCFEFLKQTGQVTGTMKKMRLMFNGQKAKDSITWLEFKHIIENTDKAEKIKKRAGLAGVKDLRKACAQQIKNGTAIDMRSEATKLEETE